MSIPWNSGLMFPCQIPEYGLLPTRENLKLSDKDLSVLDDIDL